MGNLKVTLQHLEADAVERFLDVLDVACERVRAVEAAFAAGRGYLGQFSQGKMRVTSV